MKKKQAVREAFRNACLARDKYKCKTCGGEATEVHHIVDRRFLPEELKYVPENGISLCNECHQKAEKFHQTETKSWVEGYHPNDLYDLIHSPWRLQRVKTFAESWY